MNKRKGLDEIYRIANAQLPDASTYKGNECTILNRDLKVENVNYGIKASYLKNLIDVLPVSINPPNDRSIANRSLTEKIKILSDYVVLIKVK